MEISTESIVVQDRVLHNIPLLLVYPSDLQYRSIIFLYHKLLKNKEDELPLAYKLAKAGYFIIALDMYGHGQREPSFDKYKSYNFNHIITDIYNTAKDTGEILKDHRLRKEFALDGIPAGTVGSSVGATVALGTAMLIKEISFAASLIGTLDLNFIISQERLDSFKFYAATEPVMNYKKAGEQLALVDFLTYCSSGILKPVIFLDGQMDTTVPSGIRNHFYMKLRELYKQYGKENAIKCKYYSKAGHEVTYQMQQDLISWLKEI